MLLRREEWKVNHKLVYRIYREEGLEVRTKKRRKRASALRVVLPAATSPNERWSMDFVSDSLHDGRRFRVLTLVDHFSRVSPAIEVGSSITGTRVVAVLVLLAGGCEDQDRGVADRLQRAASAYVPGESNAGANRVGMATIKDPEGGNFLNFRLDQGLGEAQTFPLNRLALFCHSQDFPAPRLRPIEVNIVNRQARAEICGIKTRRGDVFGPRNSNLS